MVDWQYSSKNSAQNCASSGKCERQTNLAKSLRHRDSNPGLHWKIVKSWPLDHIGSCIKIKTNLVYRLHLEMGPRTFESWFHCELFCLWRWLFDSKISVHVTSKWPRGKSCYNEHMAGAASITSSIVYLANIITLIVDTFSREGWVLFFFLEALFSGTRITRIRIQFETNTFQFCSGLHMK